MRRLAVDDVEVLVDRQVRSRPGAARASSSPSVILQRRVAEPLDDLEVAVRERHAHRGGVDPVAEQHRQVVAPELVERRLAAPQGGVVDDVVVDQRRGVDELDDRGVGHLLVAVVPEQAGRRAAGGPGASACRRRREMYSPACWMNGTSESRWRAEDRLGGDQLVRPRGRGSGDDRRVGCRRGVGERAGWSTSARRATAVLTGD